MKVPGPRDVYDRVERLAAPRAKDLTHSEEFAQTAAVVVGLNKAVRSRLNRVAAKAWHTLNLPAGTDVQRLRNQVGALDRQVRLMSLELERSRREAGRESGSAKSTGTGTGSGSSNGNGKDVG